MGPIDPKLKKNTNNTNETEFGASIFHFLCVHVGFFAYFEFFLGCPNCLSNYNNKWINVKALVKAIHSVDIVYIWLPVYIIVRDKRLKNTDVKEIK